MQPECGWPELIYLNLNAIYCCLFFPRSVNLHSALWYCIHCCYRLDKTQFCFCCSKREHLYDRLSKFQIMFPYPAWGKKKKKKSHTFQNHLTIPKSSPGCLNCGTTDILDQIILHCEGYPSHCTVNRSSPGLSPINHYSSTSPWGRTT